MKSLKSLTSVLLALTCGLSAVAEAKGPGDGGGGSPITRLLILSQQILIDRVDKTSKNMFSDNPDLRKLYLEIQPKLKNDINSIEFVAVSPNEELRDPEMGYITWITVLTGRSTKIKIKYNPDPIFYAKTVQTLSNPFVRFAFSPIPHFNDITGFLIHELGHHYGLNEENAWEFAFGLSNALYHAMSDRNNLSDRVSITGAHFRNIFYTEILGESYFDPSGIIWGSPLVKGNGQPEYLLQHQADKYCKSIKARLPTRAEADRLGKYLGRDSEVGYSPYIINTDIDILPGGYNGRFSNSTFWTSEEYKNVGIFEVAGYAFHAASGTADLVLTHDYTPLGNIWGGNGYAQVRCVLDR